MIVIKDFYKGLIKSCTTNNTMPNNNYRDMSWTSI